MIVCNHVSFVDALVIAAACRRPVRFVMDHRIFKLPVLSFVFRTGRAIPIASAKEDPAMMERAFAEVAKALREGDLVAIFPEGRITDTGELYPFRPGIKRILEATPVPVVPMALRGLWGSFFSRKGGAAMSKPCALRAVPQDRPGRRGAGAAGGSDAGSAAGERARAARGLAIVILRAQKNNLEFLMARSGKAAVCRELNKPVVVETISVDSPKRGEVMVKLAACGVCHSDLSATNGTIPLPPPLVLGHEGAGEVVEVGDGVAGLAVGDHVVTSFIYMCGKCRYCAAGRPVLCVEQGKALLRRPKVRRASRTGTASRSTFFRAAA